MERPETPAAEEEDSSSFSEATDQEEGKDILDKDAMQEDWNTWNNILKLLYLFNFDSWKPRD